MMPMLAGRGFPAEPAELMNADAAGRSFPAELADFRRVELHRVTPCLHRVFFAKPKDYR